MEKDALLDSDLLQLPIAVYETIVDASDAGGDNTNIQFVATTHQMAAEQIERIGVEHVARHAGAATAAAQSKTTETSAADTDALREFLGCFSIGNLSSCRLQASVGAVGCNQHVARARQTYYRVCCCCTRW